MHGKVEYGFAAVLAAALVFGGFTAVSASAAPGDDLIVQGDALFKQRIDLDKADHAARLYRKAMAVRPNDAEPAWKLARILCWMSEKTHDNKPKRLALATEAMEAAQKAAALAPDRVEPHFFLGLAYIYYGDAKGIFEVAHRWPEAKAEFDRVLELDPGYLGGAAYTLLGRFYYYVPEMIGGSRAKALDYYAKALHYGPRQFGTHIYLAEHYINEGQLDKARALLEQVMTGPPMEGQEPEWEEWKPEAEHYLRKVAEKEAKKKK